MVKPILPLWAALVVAAASGPILDAGFPGIGVWPLTFLGIGLVLVALIGRSIASALLVGFIAGATFYFTHIQWASLFLGPLPMSALAVLESLFFAVGAVAIALAYRWIPAAWPGTVGRLLLLPVAVAGLWTAREAWSNVWPYGGFAWGRVALSQSDSAMSPLFAWLGVSGVSFVMVLLVALTIEAVRYRGVKPLVRASAAVGLASVLLVLPVWPVAIDGSVRVAAVQGNGKAGYFDERQRGDLLQAQVDATAPLFGQTVDLVLWPEGASDISPLDSEYAASVFDYVTEQMDAPLIAGVIIERDDKVFNSSVLWEHGVGITDYYDKRHPIPFGEYIPDRPFWRPFAPELIDLVAREYTPGTTDMVLDVNGLIVGVNICFDISDDQALNDSIRDGARVIFAQSNNADFGRTDESAQQLAIARIRAIELGRSVINISTVGISAVIESNGRITAELPWFEAGAMVEDVPLSSVVTPAAALGRQIEWFVSLLALLILMIAAFASRGIRG